MASSSSSDTLALLPRSVIPSSPTRVWSMQGGATNPKPYTPRLLPLVPHALPSWSPHRHQLWRRDTYGCRILNSSQNICRRWFFSTILTIRLIQKTIEILFILFAIHFTIVGFLCKLTCSQSCKKKVIFWYEGVTVFLLILLTETSYQ
jgi:hypothetical protein